MKGCWLYLAIAYVTMGLADGFYERGILAAIWLLVFRHVLDCKERWKIFIWLFLFVLFSFPLNRKIDQGTVVSIRNGYQVIRNGFDCVMIYSSDDEAELDDIVSFDCELYPINSYDNFEISTFKGWAKGQNIHYQGSVDKYHIINKKLSIRKLIYRYNKESGNLWINQLLFGSGVESDSDYAYFISSSGMHISFLISFIRKKLSRWFYPERTLHITINITFIIAFILRFPYGYLRVLLSLLAEEFIEDRRDMTGWQICFLALSKPYYIRSVSFLMPMGIKVINLFNESRSRVSTRLYMMLLQLRFYGYCDAASMFSFGLFRSLAGYYYLLGWLFFMFPYKIPFLNEISSYLWTMEKMPKVYLNGRPSFIYMSLMLWILMKYMVNKKKKYLLVLIALFGVNHCRSVISPFYTVTFLDVGQGDCACISFPFSVKGLMIDTGGLPYKDVGNDIVVPYLRSQGFLSLDVIISHEDYDHIGGLEAVEHCFAVKNLYLEKTEMIRSHGLSIFDPMWDREYEDINENSLISYFRIGKFGFLLMGDASKEVEEEMVKAYHNLDVDVLKVGHHGSYTATCEKLLSAYRIPMAVISCGRSNTFNHPHPSTVEKLKAYKVRVLTTKEDNAIRFYVTRRFMFYRCASGRMGIYFKS